MLFIPISAWLTGVIVSFIYGNRKLPISIFIIGSILTFAQFSIGIGYTYIAIMAVLSAIIWIANKLDMS